MKKQHQRQQRTLVQIHIFVHECIYIVYEKASPTKYKSPEASFRMERIEAERERQNKSTRYIFSLHAEL